MPVAGRLPNPSAAQLLRTRAERCRASARAVAGAVADDLVAIAADLEARARAIDAAAALPPPPFPGAAR